MSDSNFKCPNCSSDNIQSVPLAYKSGVSNLSGKIEGGGGGIAFSSGGIAPVFGVGGGTISGTQRTGLAEMVAPPMKRSISGMNILLVFIFAPYVIYLIFKYIKNIKYNKTEYPKELEKWNKLYICHRCSNVFELN